MPPALGVVIIFCFVNLTSVKRSSPPFWRQILLAEEPRGFSLPVPLATTPEDQSAPLRGLGEGDFEGHEALGGEGGPPCACIAWGRTSTDIRSWLDHPQRWRATFFFFFGGQWHKSRKEFIGSCKRTVCGQIWASGSAGPSYPQRPPGPARPSGSSSGSQTRSAARHRPLHLWELSPAGPSALFILICSA